MKIEIKRATQKDLQAVQALNNKLFDLEIDKHDPLLIKGWPYSQVGENYFSDAIQNDFVVIALCDGKVVGYLAGSENQKSYWKVKFTELDNMYIEQEYRKHGIGKLLVDEFKKWTKEKSISNMKVTASAKNQNAINFYQKMGFAHFDTVLHCDLED